MYMNCYYPPELSPHKTLSLSLPLSPSLSHPLRRTGAIVFDSSGSARQFLRRTVQPGVDAADGEAQAGVTRRRTSRG